MLDQLNYQKNMGLVIQQTLGKFQDHCKIEVSPTPRGWRFSSQENYFESFIIASCISHWEEGQGLFNCKGATVIFPDTIVRYCFDSGSILLIYPSGHIRWITEPGFIYYTLLTRGMIAAHTQGDLMLFPLPGQHPIPHRSAMAEWISAHQVNIWAKAHLIPELAETGFWIESQKIILGGSKSHCALGQMKILRPIENDYRSMQIITTSEVCIKHDPLDDIHPTLHLPSNQHYLITKLPGFSDPVREMDSLNRVLL